MSTPYTLSALWELLRIIPKGKVVSYQEIAKVLRLTSPRQVGKLLTKNPSPARIPCYKVVRKDGSLANYSFGGKRRQRELLEKEGIEIVEYRIKHVQAHFYSFSFLETLYLRLLTFFGPPGPWPWYEKEDKMHTPEEIIIGAVLTQSVNWQNVQKVIEELRERGFNNLKAFASLPLFRIRDLIKPTRYYHRKAETLKKVSQLILEKGGVRKFRKMPNSRELLLEIKGIGPETADTILLYAMHLHYFVIDEYTKRLLRSVGYPGPFSYNRLQSLFHEQLPLDLKVFQDYHALIIKWGKEKQKPDLSLSWPS